LSIDEILKSLWKLEALQSAVKPPRQKEPKARTWLSAKKVQALMETCGEDIVGQRDWIVLALLVGAGLQREELINLKFGDIHEHFTTNGKRRMVLDVKGKGAKDRAVPISEILARSLDEWRMIVGEGLIARSLGRKVALGESISAIGVFNIVRKHGGMIDEPELAPHDLRRTYAQLGFQAGVPITQISTLMGHATVATTQRYLNIQLDLEQTVSDFIPLG
jgi:integrase